VDVKITGVAASRQDCIDSFGIDLSGGVSRWTVAYASGPIVGSTGEEVPLPDPTTLVVTVNRSTYGPGGLPATLPTEGLDLVNSLRVVEGTGGATLVLIGLDEQRPFLASSSDDPDTIVLGIG
jgi:hypothetical protein